MNHQELKYQILRYYELNKEKAQRFQKELSHLAFARNFCEVVFPYESTRIITDLKLEVTEVNNLIKVQVPETKLAIYYPKGFQFAESEARLLLCEQSMESAHRYVRCPKNCTVFDVGCSEGIFTRMYCDDTNTIYGFDDNAWMAAYLNTTDLLDSYFIGKLVTKNYKFDGTFIKPLGCIKIDVEGSELDVLQAFEDLIKQFHPVIQVAVYHYHNEYKEVISWLADRGYKTFSQAIQDSRMLYPNDDIQFEPYFRFGIIIATQ